jgi:thiol-disulfide isomerase/thioredoxin/outer membrane lipoprotein-sorting protein
MTRFFPSGCQNILRCLLILVVCLGLAVTTGCSREGSKVPTGLKEKEPKGPTVQTDDFLEGGKATSGREVLNRMVIAYRKAISYADAGEVQLQVIAGGEKLIDTKLNYSMTWEQPDKIRVQACQGMVVCDGKKVYAAIEDLPGQVVEKKAPIRVTMKTLYADRILAGALTQGIGVLPQAVLLLSENPMKALAGEEENPELLEPGKIDDRECYRVRTKGPNGETTFWVDQETFVLRRIALPTEEIRRAISESQPVDSVSLVAELTGAKIDGKIPSKAFAFDVPQGSEINPFFIPPHTAQLLGKRVPDFKFVSLDGKSFTPDSLDGKVTVLDFWATWCGPCKMSLPELQKVYDEFKNNPKVAFYAISVDQSETENKTIEKTMADLKVNIPVLRNVGKEAGAFKFTGIPTTFLVGTNGVVQDYEMGGNPNVVEELPKKIKQLLDGQNIYEKLLKQYQDQLQQYAKRIDESSSSEPSLGSPMVEEHKLPETKTAPQSKPSTLKLTPLWKCAEVKSPGNILVIRDKGKTPRLAVVENLKAIAEIGLDGKVIAQHELKLDENEVVDSLRTNVGKDGHRYTVAFLTTQQRCHLLDENWKTVLSYPGEALKKPHGGIADVEISDLDGDGVLKMYISYWGVVGVQAVSLEGKRLWANRSLSNVIGIAVGGADEKGQRDLYCTDNTRSLITLDAKGERHGEVKFQDQVFYWIADGDLQNNGKPLWCGLKSPSVGETVAVGYTLSGETLWEYPLPVGVQPQPVEPIVSGRITKDGPGQWILPGADGSVHFLSAEGKLIDKFNTGAVVQGLATVEIDGKPALIVSSPHGIEAWTIE